MPMLHPITSILVVLLCLAATPALLDAQADARGPLRYSSGIPAGWQPAFPEEALSSRSPLTLPPCEGRTLEGCNGWGGFIGGVAGVTAAVVYCEGIHQRCEAGIFALAFLAGWIGSQIGEFVDCSRKSRKEAIP